MEKKEEQREQISVPKIYAAISGVMADVAAVGKDKVNKQQGFKFRSIDDVYNALHPALAKNKVFIVPRVLEREHETLVTKNGGKMFHVICNIKFTFYAEDGSSVETTLPGEAMDTGDKAINKAMAIAYKYACFQVFCIPTEEMTDPDAERPEMEDNTAPAPPKQKAKAEGTATKPADEPKEEQLLEKITEAMLNTIRSEQKRTGATDRQILGRKFIKAIVYWILHLSLDKCLLPSADGHKTECKLCLSSLHWKIKICLSGRDCSHGRKGLCFSSISCCVSGYYHRCTGKCVWEIPECYFRRFPHCSPRCCEIYLECFLH